MIAIVQAINIGQRVFTEDQGAGGFPEDDGIPLFRDVKRDGMVCTVTTKGCGV